MSKIPSTESNSPDIPIDRPETIGCGGAEISSPYLDFVKIVEGFGIPARHGRDKKDLRAAIREMVETDGPYVLDVLIPEQEHVLPMIPSGMTVKDIIEASPTRRFKFRVRYCTTAATTGLVM